MLLKMIINAIMMKKILFLESSLGLKIWEVPCFANAKGNKPTKVPIEKFFFIRDLSLSQKVKFIKFCNDRLYSFGSTFEQFGNGGCTGVNACQIAHILGYEKILLIGVDCNYKEVVDGAKKVGDRLLMEKTPDQNPSIRSHRKHS